MTKELQISGNYIKIDRVDDLLDKSSSLVEIRRKTSTSQEYSVYYNGACQAGYSNCLWSEFTINGVPFVDQDAFEDWKDSNTAGYNGVLDDILDSILQASPPNPVGLFTRVKQVVDGSIPSGAKVVSFLFQGNGGTLQGADAPNGLAQEVTFPNGEDLPQINYTVPTSGGANIGVYISVLS